MNVLLVLNYCLVIPNFRIYFFTLFDFVGRKIARAARELQHMVTNFVHVSIEERIEAS